MVLDEEVQVLYFIWPPISLVTSLGGCTTRHSEYTSRQTQSVANRLLHVSRNTTATSCDSLLWICYIPILEVSSYDPNETYLISLFSTFYIYSKR
jgi:hypothetical protein